MPREGPLFQLIPSALKFRYWYFPVVPPISLDWRMEPTEWESPVHIPEYVAYMEEQKRGQTPTGVFSDSKFAPDAPDIRCGIPKPSTLNSLLALQT
jgi:hypothetical protein